MICHVLFTSFKFFDLMSRVSAAQAPAPYPSLFNRPQPGAGTTTVLPPPGTNPANIRAAGGSPRIGRGMASQTINGSLVSMEDTSAFSSSLQNTGPPSIEPTTVRASLLSAVEDKLKWRLAEAEHLAQVRVCLWEKVYCIVSPNGVLYRYS